MRLLVNRKVGKITKLFGRGHHSRTLLNYLVSGIEIIFLWFGREFHSVSKFVVETISTVEEKCPTQLLTTLSCFGFNFEKRFKRSIKTFENIPVSQKSYLSN